jgi:hypothetical protein
MKMFPEENVFGKLLKFESSKGFTSVLSISWGFVSISGKSSIP